MIYAKSLKVGDKVAAIKVEAPTPLKENTNAHLQIRAVYVLLGGYNEMGRSVDLKKYHALKRKFDNIVNDMAAEMHEAGKEAK